MSDKARLLAEPRRARDGGRGKHAPFGGAARSRWLTALLLSLLAWSAASCSRPQQTDAPTPAANAASLPQGEPAFLDGFFPIGVFSQPAESFEKWKSRGINTLLEVPQGHDPVAWDRAAQQAGMRIIRRPLADPRADIGRTDLLAWSHWDEPDAAGRIFEWTPLFERTYAEWRRIDPHRRVFLNLAGPDVSWFLTRTDDYSRRYSAHYPRLLAVTDWVANDLYPCGGYLNQAHARRRGDVTLLAEPIRVLRHLTDKPQFAFVETSEVEAGNVPGARCPTAEEVRAQIWYLLVHGVRGIFYFPAVVGTNGFQFDGTPADTVREITRQNAVIATLAPLLQRPINEPAGLASSEGPVEVGWRADSRTALIIAVNPSWTAVRQATIAVDSGAPSCEEMLEGRTLALHDRRIADDFPPLGVRVYRLTR
jgi:hypothetical protein